MSFGEELLRWAKVDEVLSPDEQRDSCVRADFLALMQEIAAGLAGNRTPGAIDYVVARGMAIDLWNLRREDARSGAYVAAVMAAGAQNIRKQAIFKDLSERTTNRKVVIEGLDASIALHETMVDAVYGESERIEDADNVIPLKKKAR